MAKVYDVIAMTGEYKDKDGNMKKSWTRCGAIFEKDGKQSLKMDAHAVGNDGWYILREPQQREQQAPRNSEPVNAGQAVDDFGDSDIPFN